MDSPTASAFELLLFFGLYFLPTILAYRNQRSSGPAGWSMVMIAFLINLLMGWSIIGWFWALKFARMRPEDAVAGGSGGTAPPRAPAGQLPAGVPAGGAQPRVCSACGGARTQTCTLCGAQGGRWRAPQSANDVAQWERCGFCTGSGRVPCTTCNATGLCW